MNTPALKSSSANYQTEIKQGERFGFGKNWANFLKRLDEPIIEKAIQTLKDMLQAERLDGKTFVDIGSGSGLFSLAARRLGAKVHSFDYDLDSVGCTRFVREKYFPNDSNWKVEQGSALDENYLKSLGTFDIVYSWGVLHHTGDMWAALKNVAQLVKPTGTLYISIYNDAGKSSIRWLKIKKIYNKLPKPFAKLLAILALLKIWGPTFVSDFLRGNPLAHWRSYKDERGMDPWIDVLDWTGGLPFEFATPASIFQFYKGLGFSLENQKIRGGHGCNEYVFKKI